MSEVNNENNQIDIDIKKWKKKSLNNGLEYIRKEDKELFFIFKGYTFIISCSELIDNKNGIFLINTFDNPNLTWLGFLNIYTHEKKPTLYKLLN